jgi:hypothetical protein
VAGERDVEVFEDEEVDPAEATDEYLAGAGGSGLGEVEGGAVEHRVAGLDGAHRDAEADVELAQASRPDD